MADSSPSEPQSPIGESAETMQVEALKSTGRWTSLGRYGTFTRSMAAIEQKGPSATAIAPRKGKARALNQEEGYNAGNKWNTVRSWFASKDLYLMNVGSVARDHLAASALQTFNHLAWEADGFLSAFCRTRWACEEKGNIQQLTNVVSQPRELS